MSFPEGDNGVLLNNAGLPPFNVPPPVNGQQVNDGQHQVNDGQHQVIDDQHQANMAAVTARIQVPAFWPDHPDLWFHQIEAKFNLNRITAESTKYRWVVAGLEAKYAREVIDIISQVPLPPNPYTLIKTKLIERLTESRQARLHQLLAGEELGDRRPSQVLRHLRTHDPLVPEDIVRTVWLDHLPTVLKAALITQITLPLEGLGQMADSIHEVIGSISVAALNQPQNPTMMQPGPQPSTLETRVDEMSRQLAALTSHFRQNFPRSRSQSRSRNNFRNNSRNNQANDDRPCWFHRRFAERATRCRQPCTWTGRDARANQGNAQ